MMVILMLSLLLSGGDQIPHCSVRVLCLLAVADWTKWCLLTWCMWTQVLL